MALTRAALATCRLLRVAPPARTRHAVHALPSAGPAAPPCRAASAVRRSSTGAPRGAHVPSFYAARVRGYRPRHIAAWATAVGIAGAIAYCAGQDEVPFTGRSRLMLISTDIERGWGEMVFRAVVKDASERDEIVAEDDPRVALVHKVGHRLAAIVDERYDWEFVVMENSTANASCYPGGKVVVHTGLLDNIRRRHPDDASAVEARLAVVLSHEIAHALARHTGERLSRNLVIGPVLVPIMLASPLLQYVYEYAMRLPQSRAHEFEADVIGVMLLAAACYDVDVASDFWAQAGDYLSNDTSRLDDYLATHPAFENLRLWIPSAKTIRYQFCEGDTCHPTQRPLQPAPH